MLTKVSSIGSARRATPEGVRPRGFTLIELLVSVAIFTVVMVVSLGALLAMSEADRKAQTLKTVINNLDIALESMTRTIRTGIDYKCGSPTGDTCTAGTPYTFIALTAADGRKVAYCLNGTALRRQIVPVAGTLNSNCSDSTYFETLTASEVIIEKMDFYVIGNSRTDNTQPRVTLLLSGYVAFKAGQPTRFNIQTMATQRLYDQ